MNELPYFVPPMLAVHGSPFDSQDYIFELKWDGFRAICARDASSYRLMSRNSINFTPDFPELAFLDSLPAGTMLDGEIVALVEGKPYFGLLKSRRGSDVQIAYFAFDVLFEKYESKMELPLLERKKILESVTSSCARDNFTFNSFVDTHGKIFYEKVRLSGLEGIMAKQKSSLYLPGRREKTWKKIKNPSEIPCVVIGYIPRERSFKSLLVASEINGELLYVGRVGTGFSVKQKDELLNAMRKLSRSKPVIPCPEDAEWIEPEIYCNVAYIEFTRDGMLRAPVFKSLV